MLYKISISLRGKWSVTWWVTTYKLQAKVEFSQRLISPPYPVFRSILIRRQLEEMGVISLIGRIMFASIFLVSAWQQL